MNIPCAHNQPCCDDINSFGNYSSEEPDRLLFRSYYFPNMIWDDDLDIWVACAGQCVSEVSQEEADLCAQNNAKICERNKQFGNTEYTGYRTCSDGQQYSITVPTGTFFDLSQAQANALAVNWATNYLQQLCDHIADPSNPPPLVGFPRPKPKADCNDRVTSEVLCFEGGKGIVIAPCMVWGSSKEAANEKARSYGEAFLTNNIGCLIEFGKSVCVGEPVDKWIVPDRAGAFYAPLTWEVFGAVPAGLVFTPVGIAMHITGTFNQAGRWGFRLTLTDQFGTYTYRNYIVEAMEITEPATLPDAQENSAYSHTITVQNGWDPKTFAIRSDSVLPTGLTLDGSTGTIQGTPTTFGTFTFWVVVVDKYSARCDKEFTLTIDPDILSQITWTTLWQPDGNGVGQATALGGQVLLEAIDPGGSVPSGGIARADCVWNCFNPTPNPIQCSILITQTRLHPVPPEPVGIQWGAIGGYYFARNDVPIIVANSAGLVPIGVHGPFLFTVPPGASQWLGNFITYAGTSGSVPYLGGNAILTVQLSLL